MTAIDARVKNGNADTRAIEHGVRLSPARAGGLLANKICSSRCGDVTEGPYFVVSREVANVASCRQLLASLDGDIYLDHAELRHPSINFNAVTLEQLVELNVFNIVNLQNDTDAFRV